MERSAEPNLKRGGEVVAALLRELQLGATLLSPLIAHADAVEQDADRLGLVSATDSAEILIRHTADSLLFALAHRPTRSERWVDVGSGAGFPGLVLAICFPDAFFTLVEPQARRAGFLELERASLGLDNVEVAVTRASDLPATFDVAVARALAEPLLALEALRRLCLPHGTAILAVGPEAGTPAGVADLDVARPGVDSPGRLFMMGEPLGGA